MASDMLIILHEFQQVGEGLYMGIISLARQLDYETQSGYSLVLQASDASSKHRLTATANVIIDVKDVQDQAPVFQNAPYSATLQENTPPVSIYTIALCVIPFHFLYHDKQHKKSHQYLI